MPMGTVLFELNEAGIGTILLDYATKRNILSEHMMNQLEGIIQNLKDKESKVKAIIVRSNYPEFFSAGGDIKEWYSYDKETAYYQGNKGGEIFASLENLPVLTIAAISGTCLGGGNELSLACDIRICTKDSIFGQPEVNLGNGPSWGGYYRLARKIGLSKAREIILLGETYTAEEAYRFGLVNQVVSDWKELIDTAFALASKGSKNYDTIAISKNILNNLENEMIKTNLTIDAQSAAYFADTPTSNSRKLAFIEKRLHEFL
jgi:enoyl-CoA hydratase